MKKYREEGFPVTIVRPSHTYDERHIPLGVHGKNGFWQVIKRMMEGKPVIIQGDGTSLWTLTWNQIYATIEDALDVELKPYYVSSEYLAVEKSKGSLISPSPSGDIFTVSRPQDDSRKMPVSAGLQRREYQRRFPSDFHRLCQTHSSHPFLCSLRGYPHFPSQKRS